jgi:dipeptidyl aminopeptidase/acylaminoacyl peptidase
MRRLALVLSLAVAAHAKAQPAVLSADELTSIRSVVSGMTPQWAPDGSRLLFSGAMAGSDLWTVSATGGFPTSLAVDMGEIAFLQTHQPSYSPDGLSVAYISNRTGPSELFVRSLKDGHEIQLTNLGGRINSYSWSPDGQSIALADDRFGNYDIYKVAVPSGTLMRLTADPRNDVFPSWTPDGHTVVYDRLDVRWLDHEVMALDANGAGTPRRVILDTDFFDYGAGATFGYPQVSPDGSTLLFRSQRSGWVNFWVVPMAGGVPRVVAAETANQIGARWSPDGKSILYLSLHNGMQDLHIVPASGGTPRLLVSPGEQGVINNATWSPDGARVSYTLESPTAPADLYVIPAAGGTPLRLTVSSGPPYMTHALIAPRKVQYKSPDGLTISAYLYEPVLGAGEKAPGILLIHGGPTSSFNDTYQVQAQYFAMRGYAVLLPNIRGSSGYGKTFEDANNGCWGRCDLKDVVAGVEFLRQQPYIDPTRTGITGTSYGGCMTLAASAFAPGVFQAGIAASGYGDWLAFNEEQELRHIKLLNYELGTLPQAHDTYYHSSPIYFIDSIQTPIFLIHGAGKQIPRSEASRIFADRLEMRYKPFKYKTYPNENYYIQRPDNIRVMLGDMKEFFDQNLKDHMQPVGK